MRNLYLIGILITLCAIVGAAIMLPARAQAKNNGRITGTLIYDDGTPYAIGSIRIITTEKKIVMETTLNKDGSFSIEVPAGDLIVAVGDQMQRVTVVAGEDTTVEFPPFKRVGVIVNVVDSKNNPVNAQLYSAYKSPTQKNPVGLGSTMMGKGKYSFQNIPADITDFAVIGIRMDAKNASYFRHQWHFDEAAPFHEVTLTIPGATKVSFPVLNADNAPWLNTQVRMTLVAQNSVLGNFLYHERGYWGDVNDLKLQTQRINGSYVTDAAGVLNLGEWPAGQYEITLRAGTQSGAPEKFEITPEGQVTLEKYVTSSKPRQITQTVFGADNKPAPKAEVHISYALDGKMIIDNATSDADGKVIWKNVPTVRAISWGDGVAAGVIPADATEVTEPLPAPVPEGNVNVQYVVPDFGEKQTQISWLLRSQNNGVQTFESQYIPEGKVRRTTPQQTWSPSGVTLTVLAIAKTSPIKFSSLENVYIPYTDGEQNLELPLTASDGSLLKGKFTLKDGKSVPGVSQLDIIPIEVKGLPSLLTPEMCKTMGIMQPRQKSDGTFTVDILKPGTYRLLVDMLDKTTPALPELTLNIGAGTIDKTLTLPDPILASVAPGAEICYVTRNSPADTRKIIVKAPAKTMAVFGLKTQTLACWFRPTPETLEVWNFAGEQPQKRTYTLRSIDLSLVDADGNPLPGFSGGDIFDPRDMDKVRAFKNGDADFLRPARDTSRFFSQGIQIMPFLPVAQIERYSDQQPNYGQRLPSESRKLWLRTDTNNCVDLWIDKLLIGFASMPGKFQSVDVPALGQPADVIAKIDTDQPVKIANSKTLRLKFPNANYDNLRKTAAQNIDATFDVPSTNANQVSPWYLQRGQEVRMQIPGDAKTVTFSWPGVGMIKDVVIPEGDTVIALPDWEEGVNLSGMISLPDGKPFAKGILTLNMPNQSNYNSMQVTTDEQGRFIFKNINLGVYNLYPSQMRIGGGKDDMLINEKMKEIMMKGEMPYYVGGNNVGWALQVPAEGINDLDLHMTLTPAQISVNTGGSPYAMWWFPDGGKPTRIPCQGNQGGSYDMEMTPGWLWTISNQGYERYSRLTPAAGWNYLIAAPTGPTLGITFPFDLDKGAPTTVTLAGLDKMEGVTATFTEVFWQPSQMLGLTVGQINAVPPGTYQVTVQTPQGPVESDVTVTDAGGYLELKYP